MSCVKSEYLNIFSHIKKDMQILVDVRLILSHMQFDLMTKAGYLFTNFIYKLKFCDLKNQKLHYYDVCISWVHKLYQVKIVCNIEGLLIHEDKKY